MAKFSDAIRDTLIGYFNDGDYPSEAQFTDLITRIQEGIEEHDHAGSGDGDGVNNLVGPVGIGVTPLRLFHISDGAGDFAYMHMTTDATGNLSTDGFTVGYRSDTPEAIIRNRENSLLTLWTNNTIRMTIAAAGAVKIASLAGAGARNVVAAADGTLSAP